MPAWSDEVAGIFLALATSKCVELDQMQLQKLVYVAHGWRLAFTGEPLTGDRPEALAHGPEYRRLAEQLASCGTKPVPPSMLKADSSVLDQDEVDLITSLFQSHGSLTAAQLSAITRDGSAPWAAVFRQGAGKEISHVQVRQQFEAFRRIAES